MLFKELHFQLIKVSRKCQLISRNETFSNEWITLSFLLIWTSYLQPEMISKFSNILLSFIQADSSLVVDVFCARTLNFNIKSEPSSKYIDLHPRRKLHLQFNIQNWLNTTETSTK